jgi:glycosyltransferase involved in cell wall biosynthesis
MLSISVIIPVFNRPEEIRELLESLTKQSLKEFEVIVVEDGSVVKCHEVVDLYKKKLNVKYHFQENTGPGGARNKGAAVASGNYLVFFDSDCVIPDNYIEIVSTELQINYTDAFGGPDKADASFTPIQKAINYSMTSFYTTGGIRGGNNKLDRFHPRSFNMGISKEVFESTGGFSSMRFGEDIDFSLRILKSNNKTALIKDAFVYHKRRTNFRQFYKQVFNSGIARINLYKRHPGSLKAVHVLPFAFIAGFFILVVLSIFNLLFLIPVIFYIFVVFIDSSIKNSNISVGFLSIISSFIQLSGYGLGFMKSFWIRIVLGKDEFHAFKKNFYK